MVGFWRNLVLYGALVVLYKSLGAGNPPEWLPEDSSPLL